MTVVTDDAGHGLGSALQGRTGTRTQAELLACFGSVTGTVAFGSGAGWSLVVVRDGEVVRRTTVAEAPRAAAIDLRFVLHEHELSSDPRASAQLPSLFPEAHRPGLACIPLAPDVRELPSGLVSLTTLDAHLAETGFRGVLAAHGDLGSVATVVIDGRFVAATGDRSGHELRGPNALRLLARHALESGAPPLRLVPLPAAALAAVCGVMLGRPASGDGGIQVKERLASMRLEQDVVLDVRHAATERLGRFASVADATDLPALSLPEGPLDWETRTYQLTLRGRDVLDPMTEIAMRFDAEHGKTGKRLLDALQRGLDAETVASQLALDLEDVGARIRRLEREGFVRAVA